MHQSVKRLNLGSCSSHDLRVVTLSLHGAPHTVQSQLEIFSLPFPLPTPPHLCTYSLTF